jgi:hypothetical protein
VHCLFFHIVANLLQVTWDEPDLLQNVKCVNPWLVEIVSSIPPIHLGPFSPPRKKFRVPQHPDFPFDGQLLNPIFHGNPLGPSNSPLRCFSDIAPAGIQGARHAQFGLPLRARLMVSPAAGCMAVPCHIELIIKLAHIIGWLISWLLG